MLARKPGFSLIELLIAITLLSVLLIFAMPNTSKLVTRLQTEADQRRIAGMIYAARHAAIQFNGPVNLCPGTTTGCGSRDTWHKGVVAFVDSNLNRSIDHGEAVIAATPSLGSSVRWRSFRNRSYLRFLPSGATDWQNGHFLFCPTPPDPELARQLVLNAAGRVYYSRDADGDRVHEDVQGKPLQC